MNSSSRRGTPRFQGLVAGLDCIIIIIIMQSIHPATNVWIEEPWFPPSPPPSAAHLITACCRCRRLLFFSPSPPTRIITTEKETSLSLTTTNNDQDRKQNKTQRAALLGQLGCRAKEKKKDKGARHLIHPSPSVMVVVVVVGSSLPFNIPVESQPAPAGRVGGNFFPSLPRPPCPPSFPLHAPSIKDQEKRRRRRRRNHPLANNKRTPP
jgi:hypothetical protein